MNRQGLSRHYRDATDHHLDLLMASMQNYQRKEVLRWTKTYMTCISFSYSDSVHVGLMAFRRNFSVGSRRDGCSTPPVAPYCHMLHGDAIVSVWSLMLGHTVVVWLYFCTSEESGEPLLP